MEKDKWYKKWYIFLAATVFIFGVLDQWITNNVMLYVAVGVPVFITLFAILAHFHNKKK